MALKTTLETKNGLNLAAAILVITSLNDNRTVSYSYSANLQSQAGSGSASYNVNENDGPQNHANFQVSVFASEAILRDGQNAIGKLQNEDNGQEQFQLVIDDNLTETRIEQAYSKLLEIHQDAISVDVSDLGLL